jgi:hypothetical protein
VFIFGGVFGRDFGAFVANLKRFGSRFGDDLIVGRKFLIACIFVAILGYFFLSL